MQQIAVTLLGSCAAEPDEDDMPRSVESKACYACLHGTCTTHGSTRASPTCAHCIHSRMPPIDAQWERVEQLASADDEWEVVEDRAELVTLDVSGARAAGIDPEFGPGTEVSVTVRTR